MKRRLISMLLALVLCLSLLPLSVFAAEEQGSDATASVGEMTVEGTNGFGTLLSAEIAENQEETESAASSGYVVTGLKIEGNTATVIYSSLEDATLVVAVYTEDGLELLCSGWTDVTADETEAAITIEGEMPEYFLASAYLLDSYDMSPLSTAFETPMYTRDMQELLASTVEDYDADRVLNLDDDNTTNFAVFTEDTVLIEEQPGVNTVVSANGETSTYVIEHADESITGLRVGEIFAYPYGESEILIVKVADIKVSGTTATITGDEMEMEEVFDYMKLEGTATSADAVVDESAAVEGVTYEGLVDTGITTYADEGGGDFSLSNKFSLNLELLSTDNAKVTVKGSFKMKHDIEFDYYITLKKQYIYFKDDVSVTFSAAVSGKIKSDPIPLLPLMFPIVPGVAIGFQPKFEVEVTGTVEMYLKTSVTVGMDFKHQGLKKPSFQNLSTPPKTEYDAKMEVKVFVGFDLSPSIVVLEKVLTMELGSMLGIEISGEEVTRDSLFPASGGHVCARCLDGTISGVLEVTFKISLLDTSWLTFTGELFNLEVELAKFYYSYDFGDFGWGCCPYSTNLLTVLVLNEAEDPVSGAVVSLGSGEELGTTDKSGVLSVYLTPDDYMVKASANGETGRESVDLTHKAQRCVIVLKSQSSSTSGGIPGATKPDTVVDNSTQYTGYCGAQGSNLTWKIDTKSRTLTISGEGEMADYMAAYHESVGDLHDAPWFPYFQSAEDPYFDPYELDLIVEEGVTSLGDWAFSTEFGSMCFNKVYLPTTLVEIGEGTFYHSGADEMHYAASKTQWNEIAIGDYNNLPTIHYNSSAPAALAEADEEPTSDDTIAPISIHGGEYDSTAYDTYTVKTAVFSGLVPGEQYVLLALVDLDTDAPLAAENLIYVDQDAAGADGTLTFEYIQREALEVSYVMACGASNKNLKDATIYFPSMRPADEPQAVNPTVVYDGITLTEGTDYVVTGDVVYQDEGQYTCYIRGIRDYAGLVECLYSVSKNITLNETAITLPQGKTATLKATVTDLSNKKVVWASTDPAVATVSTSGKVTPKKAGTAVITATASDGSVATCTVTVTQVANKLAVFRDGKAVTKTTFSARTMEEDTLRLTATLSDKVGDPMSLPEGAVVTWVSAEPAVGAVDETGLVTAMATGSAKITATFVNPDTGKKSTASCTVVVEQLPIGVELDITEGEVVEKKSLALKVHFFPENTSNEDVVWSSSDETVATVKAGKVTGKKGGTVVITATSVADPALTASCTVSVVPKALMHSSVVIYTPDNLSKKVTSLTVGADSQTQLTAVVLNSSKAEIEGATVFWASSNNSIATVDETGVVTALKGGKTTITVTTSQGKTAKVTLTVERFPQFIDILNSDDEIITGTELKVGQGLSCVLAAEVSPEDTKNKTVVWETSDKSVATVSSGKVTVGKSAPAGSTATITARSKADESIYAAVTIVVTPVAKSLSVFDKEGAAVKKLTLTAANPGDGVRLSAGLMDQAGEAMPGNYSIVWASKKPAVATVDETGLVTAVSKGSSQITATYTDPDTGKKSTATCTVTVAWKSDQVTSAMDTEQSVTMGKTLTLKATASRSDGVAVGTSSVVWTTSDETVATVKSGKITGVGLGTCIITAEAADGSGATLEFTVTVAPNLTKVALIKTKGEVAQYDSLDISSYLQFTFSGMEYTEKLDEYLTVTYTSSKPAVAAVNGAGIVTGVTAGTAKITATVTCGTITKSASFTVTVTKAKAPSGEVQLYSTMADSDLEAVITCFNEKYPNIEVVVTQGSASELTTRLDGEKGNPQGDVMWGGLADSDGDRYADIFEKWISKHDAENLEGYTSPNGIYSLTHMSTVVFVVNEDLEEELGLNITSYEDLLDPALRGKIAIADPNASSSAWNNLSNIMSVYGADSEASWSYIEQLMPNLVILASSSGVFKNTQAGEYVVGLTYEDGAVALLRNGATNIRLQYPTNGTSATCYGTALVKDCPNPENGKLFINFLCSAEGQTAIAAYQQGALRFTNANYEMPLNSWLIPSDEITWVDRDVEYMAANKETILDHWNSAWARMEE